MQVRRDGCPAVVKMVEKSLRLLLSSLDLSAVKAYVLRQCDKLHSGRASVQDFIFAPEVKLGQYVSELSAPPAAQVAMRRRKCDPLGTPPNLR